MNILTPANLIAATGGTWHAMPSGPPADRVVIDSRVDTRGAVFVAIRGEFHDGHDHAAAVAAAGASVVVVSRPLDLPSGVGVLVVDDTRAALGRLAAAHRTDLAGTMVIAVTGSSGKTTTKRLIDAVLAGGGRGTASPRSFNNEIGVPLTLLAARPGDTYLVAEIGTNHPGEIAQLAGLVRPDVAVVTNVGPAHLGAFGTLAAVAQEKLSLLDHVVEGGHAVVNIDRPETQALIAGSRNVTTFGLGPDADLRLEAYTPGRLTVEGRTFSLGLPGRHNALNALAAYAVGRMAGLDDDAIATGLSSVLPASMRGEAIDVGGISIINDAYNANPDSVAASLATFAELSADASRRIVVLGDMRELGGASSAFHRAMADDLRRLHAKAPLDAVVCVGTEIQVTADALADASFDVTHFAALDPERIAAMTAMWRPGDMVLLKASRALGLERLVDAAARVGAV